VEDKPPNAIRFLIVVKAFCWMAERGDNSMFFEVLLSTFVEQNQKRADRVVIPTINLTNLFISIKGAIL
jgi:hypothetical protein